MSGGKGGSSSGSSTSYQTSSTQIPDWLSSASQGAVQQAQALAARPYQAYTGQLVADVPQATQQAYQEVGAMQGMGMPQYGQDISTYTGLLGQASPLTSGGINDLTQGLYGQYANNVLTPTASLLGGYLSGASPVTTGQVTQGALDIMSPYSAAVIQPALQIGQQQLQQNLRQIGGQAANVGAFGGSRQGVEEGVAQAQAALGAGQTVGNLLQQGWSTALPMSEQIASLGSQQGMSAADTLAQLASSGYGTAAQQGYGAAGTNLQAGLTAAAQLPSALTAEQTAAQQQASLLQTVGAAEQNQQQNILNSQLGQFYEAQNWPVENLDLLTSVLGSVPYGSTTTSYGYGTTQQNQTRNIASGILGGAASGAAIGSAIPGVGTGIGAVAGGILGAL